MKQAYGETVTTTAFSKKVGYYYDEAIRRPIGLERHGEVRVVMVPVDEYNSLRKLFARALKSEQLKDVIGEITTAPPAFHPDAPDSYEDDADAGAGAHHPKQNRKRAERETATA